MCLKNYLRNISLFALTLGGAIMLNACGGEKKADDTAVTDTTAMSTDTATTATATTESPILSALPKTSEIPAILEQSGADFNPTLINTPTKAASYTSASSEKAALNLGVYGTDIGYLGVYNKTQDILTYFKASQKLAEHLGLSNSFGEAMQKRFQDNISNNDSLVKIVDETMLYVRRYLADNQRDATGALVVTGSFIEGLHLATGLVEKYPKDIPADVRNGVLTNLILRIIDQRKSLADVQNMLKNTAQDATVKDYSAKMDELSKQFAALNFDEKLKNNAGDFAVSDATLKGITAKVKEIRGDIVK